MNEEDEAFETVRRQSGWRKKQIEDRQEEAMRRDEVIEIARLLGWNVEHEATNSMLRRFAQEVTRRRNLEIEELKAENAEIYGLLGMAHVNLKQHLEYGFDPMTAQSTLISVGRYYPKLKAAMDEQEKNNG